MKLLKRHFIIDTKKFRLPADFVNANNQFKYIKYKISRLVLTNPSNGMQYLPQDIIIHCDIVYYYNYNDSHFAIANVSYDSGKKWLLGDNLQNEFNIWFTSTSTNAPIEIDDKKFVIECLLELNNEQD